MTHIGPGTIGFDDGRPTGETVLVHLDTHGFSIEFNERAVTRFDEISKTVRLPDGLYRVTLTEYH